MLLSSEEIRNCTRKIDARNQITFGVMIAYFKTYIKFPSNKNNTISSKLISQVIDDLEINESRVINFKWETKACRYLKLPTAATRLPHRAASKAT